MRTILRSVFFFLLLASGGLHAQVINNLVVFCNDGEKFTVILDGFKRNEVPQTNVKVEMLDQVKYKAKIIFENKKYGDVNTTITFYDNGYECTFSLDKTGHKKYKLNYLSAKLMPGFVEKTTTTGNANTGGNVTIPKPVVDTVKPTPPEPPSGNPMDGDMNQSINVGGKKGGIKVDQNGVIKLNPLNGNTGITIKKHPKANCPDPVTKEEFDAFKENMKKQLTEEDRQTIANAFIDNNCLLSSQVKEAMGLFKTERSQLDFAKRSYAFTKDFEKFSITIDGVTTVSAKDELKKYIDDNK